MASQGYNTWKNPEMNSLMLNAMSGVSEAFMKAILEGYDVVLNNMTDDECKQIMKSCYNALPEKGKFIACEPVLPHHTDDSKRTRALLSISLLRLFTVPRASTGLRKNTGISPDQSVLPTAGVSTSITSSPFSNFTSCEYNLSRPLMV
ncbi:hypothetical protein HAX54_018687 [Datura stramonium]|uniref:O-methyltransferase C-terminal domain-containing protein n=1 Tax=Datura stramonium TaxID=4076 RepID=A0ABS8UNZ7_DATST|nr:hypothetical protein [Datura stramonium]